MRLDEPQDVVHGGANPGVRKKESGGATAREPINRRTQEATASVVQVGLVGMVRRGVPVRTFILEDRVE